MLVASGVATHRLHMRRLAPIPILALLVSGCGSPELPRPAWEDPAVCADVDSFHDCARLEEDRALAAEPEVTRSGDTLIIRLADGGERHLVDRGTQVETVRFAYGGYFEAIGYHLVRVSFYEGSEYRLVHGATGEVTAVESFPHLSPDARRLVVAANEGVAGYAPNLLQVWRVTDGGLAVEWQARPEDWGADAARWVDPSTVRFDRTRLCDGRICRTPATLRLRDGQWTVTTDTGSAAGG